MLKFIRGKGQQPSVERQRLQKELFSYRKTAQHGFPHKPSALAFDEKTKLMAIGTHSGAIKIFGQPGIEFYGQHTIQISSATDLNVQLLEWVHGTGNILSLTASNQLFLWEPVGSTLVATKTLSFDGKLKKVSSLCCSYAKDIVWIGTEGGNIYHLDLKNFNVKEPAIYHDIVLEQVPPTYKLNPGAIESIKQIPNAWNQLLIAYNRGLCVLWDVETSCVIRSFIAPGHGQSVGLYINTDGTQFTWYHADGSFATWQLNDPTPPSDLNYVPYGPDPCKSINRLFKGIRSSDNVVIFSGGMPRSAYGDHNTVSVHVNDKKICLDFTSKVIDFFVTYSNNSDEVDVLIVLLEEELCAYDLTDPKLPVIKAPYLHSIHASAVTCNQLISQVSKEVYEKICRAGEKQDFECSNKKWPITGGILKNDDLSENIEEKHYEIMLTGHEDGSVKFWNCTDIVMTPIYHLKTSILFGNENQDDMPAESLETLDDSEPPFRRSGLFDPYSDDPRLAVKKLTLCAKTGRIIVGGTAGQIIIANFEDETIEENQIKLATMNLVSDRDGFVWKGHDQLNIRANILAENAETVGDNGVQITGILQVLPPASITCLALQTDWNLVSGGTAHGLVLFDFKNFLPVFHRCTLNPNDLTGAGEQLSRRKSFKKSLRESFRKLRKGRSTRNNPTQTTTTLDARPVERQVEARSLDDGMGSMVRCLLFAKTYIVNAHTTAATLWSATNASCVSVFLLHLPSASQDDNNEHTVNIPRRISVQLAKEIQMKHRAPIVGIAIIDQSYVPLELNGSGAPPHRVLIASEEQFKVFSLPQLKPITKYKLTAHEGARVRRLAFATFTCRVPHEILQGSPSKSIRSESGVEQNINGDSGEVGSDIRNYREIGLLCLTNLGDILVLSIPELKRQLNAAAVRREDINGISSLCFTNFGEAFYMMSSSEIQRISLATGKVVTPLGGIHTEVKEEKEIENNSDTEHEGHHIDSAENINRPINRGHINMESNSNINGIEDSPNRGNETISSSIGDITVDSVRDHLNTTTTTLCSTTTEETIGRLSVLSTQTNQTVTNVNMKDITDFNIPNLIDLAPLSSTTETSTSSVVIKSVITSISHERSNGDPETITTTKTSTREESQF